MELPEKLTLASVVPKLGTAATGDDLLALLKERRLIARLEPQEVGEVDAIPNEYWGSWSREQFADGLIGHQFVEKHPYRFLRPKAFAWVDSFERAVVQRDPSALKFPRKLLFRVIGIEPRFIGCEAALSRLVNGYRIIAEDIKAKFAEWDADSSVSDSFETDFDAGAQTPRIRESQVEDDWRLLRDLGAASRRLLVSDTTPPGQPFIRAAELLQFLDGADLRRSGTRRWIEETFGDQWRSPKFGRYELESKYDEYVERVAKASRQVLRDVLKEMRLEQGLPVGKGRRKGKTNGLPQKLMARQK